MRWSGRPERARRPSCARSPGSPEPPRPRPARRRTLFDSERGVDLPPEERRVGYVFQEYALFPHLTVEKNVAFGGKARAAELMERLGIDHLARRARRSSPAASASASASHGLSRATPRCSCSTSRCRRSTRTPGSRCARSSRRLLRELALPTLLVTHDFEDAAALADRVGVIAEGRILQVGTPGELVSAPGDAFVASFTGANLVHGTARDSPSGLTEIVLDGGAVVYSTDRAEGPVGVVVYPWEVSIARDAVADSAMNHIRAPIASLVPLGNRVRVKVGAVTGEVTSASAERLGLEPGQIAVASFKATGTRLVPLAPTRGGADGTVT